MRHGSLFSGIGMFDLAARECGWENVFTCEIDEKCNKILERHFPESIKYTDAITTDFTIHRNGVDILTAGFPCQPFSVAGNELGESDPRYLWNQVLRAAQEIKPQWIVAENVGGILSPKFSTTFERICNSLELEGYEVQPLDIHSACYELPTVERHIWIVAKDMQVGYERRRAEKISGGGRLSRQLPRGDQRDYGRWSLPASRTMRMGQGNTRELDRVGQIGNCFPPIVAYQIFQAIERIDTSA